METIVGAILGILGLYLALGFVFGIVFIFLGVQRVDPAAAGAGIFFRLMILPGVAVFWPLLALRWLAGSGEAAERVPQERSPHMVAAARNGEADS